jgi:hypothetical protein
LKGIYYPKTKSARRSVKIPKTMVFPNKVCHTENTGVYL